MKRDYKAFVDKELKENAEIEMLSISVRYADGINIQYRAFAKEEK